MPRLLAALVIALGVLAAPTPVQAAPAAAHGVWEPRPADYPGTPGRHSVEEKTWAQP